MEAMDARQYASSQANQPQSRLASSTSSSSSSVQPLKRSLLMPSSPRTSNRYMSASATMPATTSADNDSFPSLSYSIPPALQALASQRPTPLRLADMYKYGNSSNAEQRLRNAQFLHRELPIRIAQRAVDLLTLPHGLNQAAPIRQVANMYLRYLDQLQAMPPPTTMAEEGAFTDMLQGFVLDRAAVPEAIAQGIFAWSEDRGGTGRNRCLNTNANYSNDNSMSRKQEEERLQEMEDALYRFFTARVGLRFLTEHHVLSSNRPASRDLRRSTFLFPPDHNNSNDETTTSFRGCIQTNVDVLAETRKVADLVRQQTQEFYGMCPEIHILDCATPDQGPREFTYVPHHLHYMLAELLKNSCRSTVEQYMKSELRGDEEKAQLFPIRVVIVKGEEDVTIKIADKGGGIPRSLMSKIWKFGHSGRHDPEDNDGYGPEHVTHSDDNNNDKKNNNNDDDDASASFRTDDVAGARIRGFGLPLARIYARYFGGELSLKSMEGYGVDVYLHLPRLGVCCENLPLRVRASPGELDSMPSRHINSRN